MISRRTRLGVGAAVLAVGLGAALLGYRWSTADDFADAKAQAAFCRTASPLDLQTVNDLGLHDKHHILEDLSEQAPDGVHDDFGALLDWYDHFDPEDEKDARTASFAVGEFIERSCDEINIGGVRVADD
ncbi:hypothetical protein QF037_006048 [Streptomyces canus]|uniref:hypothetical protein n=1 Tax=Streptomyces canus TaxID=58343 RepID=UPI002789272D|nr:hypothetical protein [Streptomyces canus]MDQ0601703.1 hypothetical protein [Streptomyces canus]